jgi:hypothetical protein
VRRYDDDPHEASFDVFMRCFYASSNRGLGSPSALTSLPPFLLNAQIPFLKYQSSKTANRRSTWGFLRFRKFDVIDGPVIRQYSRSAAVSFHLQRWGVSTA